MASRPTIPRLQLTIRLSVPNLPGTSALVSSAERPLRSARQARLRRKVVVGRARLAQRSEQLAASLKLPQRGAHSAAAQTIRGNGTYVAPELRRSFSRGLGSRRSRV